METYIGCSGYYYSHWKGPFYPATLPKSQWLEYYAQHFNTVEINNTFYKIPREKTILNWYNATPAGFVFSLKGSREITHQKKLVYDMMLLDYLDQFMHVAALLKEKSGPILWQFPGSFKADIPRLEKFCSLLSHDFQHVFEFRDNFWYTEEVYELLERYRHTLCIVSAPGNIPEVVRATSSTVYIRFHGKNTWYDHNYSEQDLEGWKHRLEQLTAVKLFAFFNNTINVNATNNGQVLASLFGNEPNKRPDSKQLQLF